MSSYDAVLIVTKIVAGDTSHKRTLPVSALYLNSLINIAASIQIQVNSHPLAFISSHQLHLWT
ncbi:hypothetical protein BDZ89DRAFT_1059226, partial [Hymenopellis radicata]